jgi:predicted NBD/HSP70 family sugar kinase/biotin operon repressor
MAASAGGLPLRPREMRDRNRALVLDAVARHEPVTRAQLAARTGLTKSSVSSIVQELLAAGLVVEQGTQRGRDLGRPGTALTLARDGLAGLGLEVNVDYLAACVVDLARRTRVQYVEGGDNRARDPAAMAALLVRLAGAAVAAAGTQGLTISATCVAVPGLVDQGTGPVTRAPNLDWSDVPLRRLLAGRVPSAGAPVAVENEANLAALGELWFGGGAGLGDFVYVSGEVGVGAGIVVGGRLFRGAHGHAGELGHTTIDPDGAACTCGGRGCLELFAGQEAILRAAGLDPVVPTSSGRAGGPVGVLVDRLGAGDGPALAALEVAGRSLGQAAASLVKLIDPDTVVLGGIYAALDPWLRGSFQAALLTGIPMTRSAPPRVAISALGPDAAVRGAAGLVTAAMLARPGALLPASARA